MATRGAKPKPPKLRLVQSTHRVTRHGGRAETEEKAEKSAADFGKPVMPKAFRGNAAAAWKKYIAPAAWLDAAREPAAIAFCHLWDEFMFSTKSFPAAKHGQLRAYMAELGLTDERNRADGGKEAEKDEFFGD